MHMRKPTIEELEHIKDVLRRLREHFHQWPGYEGAEHELMEFAFYEGCGGLDDECCGSILAEAAPFAIGAKAVQSSGYEWLMIKKGDVWHFGVIHPLLEPIDLQELESADPSKDQSLAPGARTLKCLPGLVNFSLGRKRRKTRE